MIAVKRIVGDYRDKSVDEARQPEMDLNKELQLLQTNNDGSYNEDVKIVKITEVPISSTTIAFMILYNDKRLDIEKKVIKK